VGIGVFCGVDFGPDFLLRRVREGGGRRGGRREERRGKERKGRRMGKKDDREFVVD
jgi:hypothetical protein